MTRDRKQ